MWIFKRVVASTQSKAEVRFLDRRFSRYELSLDFDCGHTVTQPPLSCSKVRTIMSYFCHFFLTLTLWILSSLYLYLSERSFSDLKLSLHSAILFFFSFQRAQSETSRSYTLHAN